MDAASVSRAFETSRRREDLSFKHHAEVAALPPDEADALRDWYFRVRGAPSSSAFWTAISHYNAASCLNLSIANLSSVRKEIDSTNLPGAVHQIDRRCVVHRVSACFERDAL
jgi:hypothetical protein